MHNRRLCIPSNLGTWGNPRPSHHTTPRLVNINGKWAKLWINEITIPQTDNLPCRIWATRPEIYGKPCFLCNGIKEIEHKLWQQFKDFLSVFAGPSVDETEKYINYLLRRLRCRPVQRCLAPFLLDVLRQALECKSTCLGQDWKALRGRQTSVPAFLNHKLALQRHCVLVIALIPEVLGWWATLPAEEHVEYIFGTRWSITSLD